MIIVSYSLFFFQAEDGIRDVAVTGVQTCALPIWCESDQLRAAREFNWAGRSRAQVPEMCVTRDVARCQKKFIRTRDNVGEPRALGGELVLHHVSHRVADGQVALVVVGRVKSETWAEIERVPIRRPGPLLERAEVGEREAGNGLVAEVETVGAGGGTGHFSKAGEALAGQASEAVGAHPVELRFVQTGEGVGLGALRALGILLRPPGLGRGPEQANDGQRGGESGPP